jgi:hypothetical protein
VRLATFAVEIQTVQAQRIGFRLLPVEVGERGVVARWTTQCEKATIPQPGIQVHRAIKAGESMIGHDHQVGIWSCPADFANRIIHGTVNVEQLGLVPAPQYMRTLIDNRKIEKQ